MNRLTWGLMALFLLTLLQTACMQTEEADLVVHNAIIYAIDGSTRPYEAMAIKDGKIIEMGPERQILNKYKSDRKVDAGKNVIYPGFIDPHSHFLGYALSLREVNLIGTKRWEEVLERALAHHEKSPAEWLTGRGWDQNDWQPKEFPDKAKLDSLFPDVPVMLKRIDGHAAICNSKALQLAGVTAETRVAGGELILNEGELTGVLIDNAMLLVEAVIPLPDQDFKTAALKEAEANCFRKGLTSVCDAGLMFWDIELIDSLQSSGQLKMKVYAMITDSTPNYTRFGDSGPLVTDRLTACAFKFYADGALGSRGACLIEPYSDVSDQSYRGLMLNTETYFSEKFQWCYDRGFQVCTHAIGDSANRVILDLYGSVLEPLNDRRWRIEHAQVVHPDDLHKFRDFVVIPSIQPTHATSDMHWAAERLGEERVKTGYAWKELLAQLQFIPLGTDFPIEDIDPLKTFYSAVFRKDAEGYPEGGYYMENALSREETLKGMTIWAAMANFEEGRKGSLEVGKDADFVVLDTDLLKAPEERILQAKCLRTFVNGEEVYQAQ